MPEVLEHYIDPQAGRSYTLLLSVPGEDLNEVWKILPYEQQDSVLQQVAEHIDTLAQLKNDRPISAEGELIQEPWLQRSNPKTPLELRGLLDPSKSKEWEQIWGVEENKFVFYHCDLGPTNIKVEVQRGKARVTGLLDWEGAGFLPRGWIATKFRVSGGLDFDWDGEGDETIWRVSLANILVESLLLRASSLSFSYSDKISSIWARPICSKKSIHVFVFLCYALFHFLYPSSYGTI